MPTLQSILLVLILPFLTTAQGKVYFVIGSDTGIWEGLNIDRYHITLSLGLYDDPARNMAHVMDPAFRSGLRDPFGTPMKLTWWTMGGNVFRHSTNSNVPYPSAMVFSLINQYHGERLRQWGDELTLHYHTWVWTDDNGDGTYYWNQARRFEQTAADFDATLADMLLDQNLFPVSFRSGWHAMDNDWQHRLDEVLPYSLHNDWPAKRVDPTEPLDNIYDWSRSPSTFVPFHPSSTDYQVPGGGPGWNVRSVYLSRADSAFMDKIFAQAALGLDQVVCLWAHLPETDFPDNLLKAHTSATKALPRYPGVTYRYCTGVEAMQRWLGVTDSTGPVINVEEFTTADSLHWRVSTDEPIFQPAPFVAVKTRYGERKMLNCRRTGDRTWETIEGQRREDLVAFGAAATDTSGNVSTKIVRYLPEDIVVDDTSPAYAELRGSWAPVSSVVWGRTSRKATVPAGDSAISTWMLTAPSAGLYQVELQTPPMTIPGGRVVVTISDGAAVLASRVFPDGIAGGGWRFVSAVTLSAPTTVNVTLTVYASATAAATAGADVVRLSASTREQWLVVPEVTDVGEVIVATPTAARVMLRNEGLQPVQISAVQSRFGLTTIQTPLPLTVPPMGEVELSCMVTADSVGLLIDTVTIISDDPRHLVHKVSMTGRVSEFFAIVDDGDQTGYTETGTWNFSTARAYGTTSRYAWPAAGVSASFFAVLPKAGRYRLLAIVPTTVNASAWVRYILYLEGVPVDSAFVDQNAGSGAWVTILERSLPAGARARVVVTDAMDPVISGRVLRADALRFQVIADPATGRPGDAIDVPLNIVLGANYPNPFNPTTTIPFALPSSGRVTVKVFDLLGRPVATVADDVFSAGSHRVMWNASGFSSGVYICQLRFDGHRRSRVLQILK